MVSGLFEPGTYEVTLETMTVEGEVAYLVWHAACATANIVFATDTFIIRNGMIAIQTFAAKIVPIVARE
jgi:hypothetical protein